MSAEADAEYAGLREQHCQGLFYQLTVLNALDVMDHNRLVMEQRAIDGPAG